jgi:hypothetical protein
MENLREKPQSHRNNFQNNPRYDIPHLDDPATSPRINPSRNYPNLLGSKHIIKSIIIAENEILLVPMSARKSWFQF